MFIIELRPFINVKRGAFTLENGEGRLPQNTDLKGVTPIWTLGKLKGAVTCSSVACRLHVSLVGVGVEQMFGWRGGSRSSATVLTQRQLRGLARAR